MKHLRKLFTCCNAAIAIESCEVEPASDLCCLICYERQPPSSMVGPSDVNRLVVDKVFDSNAHNTVK